MSADIDVFLDDLNASETGEDWVEAMENYVDCLPGSTIDYLSLDDTSFLVKRGNTLLVVLETAEKSVGRQPDALPTGWRTAEGKGWSYLGLFNLQGARATARNVVNHIAQLAEAGSLSAYEKIVFLGMRQTCELAVTCADRVENATVVLIQPTAQETTDEADGLTGDENLAQAETGSLKASRKSVAVYDPNFGDALETVLAGATTETVHLPCWHTYYKTEEYIRAFDLLPTILEIAVDDGTERNVFFTRLREKRRSHRAYWRNLLRHLDKDKKPALSKALCENVHAKLGGRVFKRELQRLASL